MAEFQPSGIFRMGYVPFDNSYKHTRWFESKSAQNNYFSSCMLSQYTESDYTYIRHNNSVKVQVNREKVCNVNYCMFQNRNYGSKWFYAFVVGINYINENVTEIVMELDVMQTWLFDWTRTECFVEREHVSDDTIGAHTNPEPDMPLRYYTMSRNAVDFGPMAIIVQRSAEDVKIEGSWLFPNNPTSKGVDGGIYCGVYNGCQYWAADLLSEEVSNVVSRFLARMQEAGAGDAIANVYMVPKMFIRGGGITNTGQALGNQSSPTPGGGGVGVSRPSTLNGYTPKNNKMFCYPYCFCRLSDNNGASSDLLFEMFGSGGHGISYDGSMEPSGEVFVYPENYQGIAHNYNAGINFSCAVQCSWPFSSYKNWASQNTLSNALTFGINAAMMVLPAAKGVGTAAKSLGAGARWLAKRGGQANADKVAAATARTAARRGVSAASEGVGGLSMAAGAYGMSNQVGEWDRMMRQPDTVRGSASGNGIYSTGKMGFNVDVVTVTYEYAQIADEFMSMYGYQVDLVKVPNFHSRSTWNYVKTSNACMRGSVPSEDMAAINSILDSGITFWHTGAVGNYSANNGII